MNPKAYILTEQTLDAEVEGDAYAYQTTNGHVGVELASNMSPREARQLAFHLCRIADKLDP